MITFTRSIGMICLALLLVLWGLTQLFALQFAGSNIVMGILALAAGVLILIER